MEKDTSFNAQNSSLSLPRLLTARAYPCERSPHRRFDDMTKSVISLALMSNDVVFAEVFDGYYVSLICARHQFYSLFEIART